MQETRYDKSNQIFKIITPVVVLIFFFRLVYIIGIQSPEPILESLGWCLVILFFSTFSSLLAEKNLIRKNFELNNELYKQTFEQYKITLHMQTIIEEFDDFKKVDDPDVLKNMLKFMDIYRSQLPFLQDQTAKLKIKLENLKTLKPIALTNVKLIQKFISEQSGGIRKNPQDLLPLVDIYISSLKERRADDEGKTGRKRLSLEKRIWKKYPDDQELSVLLADLYRKKGKWDGYKEVLKISPLINQGIIVSNRTVLNWLEYNPELYFPELTAQEKLDFIKDLMKTP